MKNKFVFRQEILSDEEAQEVTRLLSPKDKTKWQSDISSSVIHEAPSGPSSLQQDSSGPLSLNDSLEPPSLQEESTTETVSEKDSTNVGQTVLKEPVSSYPMYDSNSSFDGSHDDLLNLRMDTSVSTCDSGLIGKEFSV